jgi:hypothetical protein
MLFIFSISFMHISLVSLIVIKLVVYFLIVLDVSNSFTHLCPV